MEYLAIQSVYKTSGDCLIKDAIVEDAKDKHTFVIDKFYMSI